MSLLMGGTKIGFCPREVGKMVYLSINSPGLCGHVDDGEPRLDLKDK